VTCFVSLTLRLRPIDSDAEAILNAESAALAVYLTTGSQGEQSALCGCYEPNNSSKGRIMGR
jgi:hypothetical protein